MRTVRIFIKNFTALILGRVLQQLLQVVFVAIFARYVGAKGFGKFSFCISVVALLSILVNFGLDTLLVREVSQKKEKVAEFVGKVLFIKISIALLLIISILGYAYFTKMDKLLFSLLLIISTYSFLNSMTTILVSCFRAYEWMEMEALLNVVGTLLYVGGGLGAILLKVDLVHIVAVLGISFFMKGGIGIFLFFRRFPKGIDIRRHFRMDWPLLKAASVFALLGGIGIIYLHTDKLMLGILAGYDSVGWYAATNKLIMAFLVIPTLFVTAIFPVFSRLHRDSLQKLQEAYINSYYAMLTLGMVTAIICFMFAENIVNMIYGGQYVNSIFILKVMAFYIIWQFPSYINGKMMVAINKERIFSLVYGTATALNILLNYIFIKMFGFIGACYASILATGFGFLFYTYYIHKYLSIRFHTMRVLKLVFSALLLIAMLQWTLIMDVNFILSVVVIVPFVYLPLIILFNVFPREHMMMIIHSFPYSKDGIRA